MFKLDFTIGEQGDASGQPDFDANFIAHIKPMAVVQVPVNETEQRKIMLLANKGRIAVVAYGLDEGEPSVSINYFRDHNLMNAHLTMLGCQPSHFREINQAVGTSLFQMADVHASHTSALDVRASVSLPDQNDQKGKLLFAFSQLTNPWIRLDLPIGHGHSQRTYLSRPNTGGHTVLTLEHNNGNVGFSFNTVADDVQLGELLAQQGYTPPYIVQLNAEGLAIPLAGEQTGPETASLLQRLKTGPSAS